MTTQLVQHGAHVIVGGVREDSYLQSKQRWKQMFPPQAIESNIEFCALQREESDTIRSALHRHGPIDLVVHTAGPFQGKVNSPNGVLEACLRPSSETMQQIPYIDVCDDYCTAMAAKRKYSAYDVKVPCIISTGCWPGVSSLMAKALTKEVLSQKPTTDVKDLKIDFSFFTAGSGGAGVTLLVATFLILSEKALTIVNGRRKPVQPMKQYYEKNFGNVVGMKQVSHLNLLETSSIHETLGIGSTASYFGTAPNFWNALLGFMARTVPADLLANEPIMKQLSLFSLPIVRVVDYFAGATNAMRCDIYEKDNQQQPTATAIYAHANLEPCVGECVTAFCCAALSRSTKNGSSNDNVVPPGLWFPEEAIPDEYVSSVLALASIGAHTTTVEYSDQIPEPISIQRDQIWGPLMSDGMSKKQELVQPFKSI